MKKTLFVVCVAVLLLASAGSAFAAGTATVHYYSGSDSAAVYGPLYNYAAPGDGAWGTSVPAVLAWKHPSWPLIGASSAAYISNTEYITGNIGANQWRWFRITVPVPSNAFNIVPSGTMKVNSDNADRTWINGRLAGTDCEVEGAFVDNHEWDSIQTYALQSGDLHAGDNYLDVVVRNYSGTNTSSGNPTGLIYDFSATYSYNENITVLVDIKPGSDPSAFNWNGAGKVPVAILGSATFDVYDIRPETVTMNNAGVALKGKKDPTVMASYQDVNADGFVDLVVHIVDIDGDVFPAGAVEATVRGSLVNGDTFTAIGDIKLTQ